VIPTPTSICAICMRVMKMGLEDEGGREGEKEG